ncbi:putative flippase GtrA [Crossiella equi]|uniref:Flippase GtrA n=1 Tax=Crossiella equi TaxID=130796 RepID=A0ABS5AG43_9PSEU|nr:GtrA family protein [Crossiella equi]MBP2474625.1 putative flippase GtrA [Crossiella equi]
MAVVETVLGWLPQGLRRRLLKHRELLKFAFVGGTTFLIDNGVFYGLKLTVLESKPLIAKGIAVLVATIVSYVLNREWSFRTRGGREKQHEAALYFLVSGIAVGIYTAPLAFSRYVLDLRYPDVTLLSQELGDFFIGQVGGVLIGMLFRWWAFRKFVFPEENVRPHKTYGTVPGQDLPAVTTSNGSANGKAPRSVEDEEQLGHS